jgi:DNA-binding NarL/FixJ family response regulator
MNQLKIAFVSTEPLDFIPIGVTVEYYSNIKQLVDELSPDNNPHLIIFDAKNLYKQEHVQLFEDLHITRVVIDCLKKYSPGRNTPLVAVLFDNSANVRQIKSVVARDDVNAILGLDELNHLSEIFLSLKIGTVHLSPTIQKLIEPKIKTLDEIQLTPRQREILTIIQQRGASNKAIARMLDITESTVKLHITSILKKYKVRNRTQLALFSN